MTYLQLDDNFAEHPKISGLSHQAFRLHVAGLCYCARHLTDGVLAQEDVPRLIRGFRRRNTDELVERLLWHPLDDGNYYQIHDYLQWNRSREEVLARRETARGNAARRWQRRAAQIDAEVSALYPFEKG